jgi:hypothetical protein
MNEAGPTTALGVLDATCADVSDGRANSTNTLNATNRRNRTVCKKNIEFKKEMLMRASHRGIRNFRLECDTRFWSASVFEETYGFIRLPNPEREEQVARQVWSS